MDIRRPSPDAHIIEGVQTMIHLRTLLMTGRTAAAALLILMACAPKPASQPVPNASFEAEKDGRPEHWTAREWSGSGAWAYEDSAGRAGTRCAGISSESGADFSWSATVPVRPFSTYRLSGWIRTSGVKAVTGKGSLLNLHGMRGAETKALTGTQDWTRVELTFDTESNDAVEINCLFGGWGYATGAAWYDDIALELLETRILAPSVSVDASKTGEPISPYLYGQFIEHLGRCIYGGLWAEMLEDRKFYYPVMESCAPFGDAPGRPWTTGTFPPVLSSPWKIIGPPGSVTMDTWRPYVGEQTPVVHLKKGETRGIRQEGLALTAGRTYSGRIVLAGNPEAAPVSVKLTANSVTLAAGSIDSLTPEYSTHPLSFTVQASENNASLEIAGSGEGYFKVGAVSLMPSDAVKGFRPEVIALLRELRSPIYRWPGGNFVSGYRWKDGIGERDLRPPRKNPAWTGVEHNDVGLHEYMDLMALIGAEPFIAVNTGLGTVEEVAEEVEYCNGSSGTPMGRLRAANGHPELFSVVWWAVGNEMYGSWQLGHMPLERYVQKHNRVAEAMRQKDASIALVGVGEVGNWSETMLRECAGHMTLLSEHIYCGEMPGTLGHAGQLAASIRWKAEAHRKYRREIPGLADKDIRIAMDEWNYWYGPSLYGEIGVRYYHKDGLGVAAGLHAFFKNSDLYFMANYAQTVNVIGCIKTTRTEAEFESTGLVLKLYRNYFGSIPVEVSGTPEPLDVSAAWTEDRKTFTLAVVNPTESAFTMPLALHGVRLKQGIRRDIAHRDPMAFNAPGQKPQLSIRESPVRSFPSALKVTPLSVTLYRMEAE